MAVVLIDFTFFRFPERSRVFLGNQIKEEENMNSDKLIYFYSLNNHY